MIVVTVEQLLNSVTALQSQLGRSDLPAIVGLRLARLAQRVERESQIVHTRLLELAHRYALRDEEGRIVHPEDDAGQPRPGEMTIDPERFQDYQAERRALLAEDVEIDAKPVRISQLLDEDGRVPGGAGAVIYGLGPLLVDDVEESQPLAVVR